MKVEVDVEVPKSNRLNITQAWWRCYTIGSATLLEVDVVLR